MAVWTIIPDSDIDPDSPFTTGLATAYRENVTAAFEGASGAPTLVTVAIKTTTVSLAGTMTTGTYANITLSPYSFFPMIHTEAGADTLRGDIRGHLTDGASADNSRFSIFNNNSNSIGYDIDYRYIQAS